MAQPVGEEGAVARVFDELPGRPVDVLHRDAGADDGLGRQIGGLDGLIYPPALVAHRAEKHRAGHVAPVAPDGDENVQDHAVPVPEHRPVGGVVGVGSVGAEADQLPLAGAVGAVLPVEALHIGGQLTLHRAGPHGGDGRLHHLVVDLGGAAHGGDLVGVLVLAGVVHRGGAQHRRHVGPGGQKGDEELAGPGLVHPQRAGEEGGGQRRRGRVAVLVEHQLQPLLGLQGEEGVGEQPARAVGADVERQHPLHRLHPVARQVVHRGGGGDYNLGQSVPLHVAEHPGQSRLIHRTCPFCR